MTIDPKALDERHRGTMTELLGIRFVEATLDRVVAELGVRDELRTVGGRLHGGSLMALADVVGATATMLNLPPGASTATLESKTNFFAAGQEGRGAGGEHAAASGTQHDGVADPGHRRRGAVIVADDPDPNGVDTIAEERYANG